MTKITIELNSDLAKKVEKLVDSYGESKNMLFESFIKEHRNRIENEIAEIEKELKKFEKIYNMSSEIFYTKCEKGEADDSSDFIIWSGIYEMQLDSKKKLKEIS